jgi:hypothetical protein
MVPKVSKPDSRKRCNELMPAAVAGPRIMRSMVRKPGSRVRRIISAPMATTLSSCRTRSCPPIHGPPRAHVAHDVVVSVHGLDPRHGVIERFRERMQLGERRCGLRHVLGEQLLHRAGDPGELRIALAVIVLAVQLFKEEAGCRFVVGRSEKVGIGPANRRAWKRLSRVTAVPMAGTRRLSSRSRSTSATASRMLCAVFIPTASLAALQGGRR